MAVADEWTPPGPRFDSEPQQPQAYAPPVAAPAPPPLAYAPPVAPPAPIASWMPPYPAPSHTPPPPDGTGRAVLALVLALVPLLVTNIAGLVLGIVGMTRDRGRALGLSIAAVVCGAR